ncbi:MAG TPA: toll/interleukin-1 receptor domain-containing protein [Allosphingosinicella sp.]|jgi:hypothetical protein|nr:toll/interleukin-1 receptor domain-containing protein [Allosphingosinicella sp.]
MAQVFISYQKRDRALVERVRDGLAAVGLTIWWDDDVTPRDQWDRILEREIEAADHVLVLWTENSIDSKWVRTEVAWTSEHKPGTLVQARFDDARIPMVAYLTQYIDLDRDEPAASPGWPKLLEWLGRPQPKPERIVPAPPPPAPPREPVSEPTFAQERKPAFGLSLIFYLGGAIITAWGLLFLTIMLSTSFTPPSAMPGLVITTLLSLGAGASFLARASFSDKLVYIWAAAHPLFLAGNGGPSETGSRALIFSAAVVPFAIMAYAAKHAAWLKS